MRVELLESSRGVRFRALVPQTRRERARGLLGAERLAPGWAMLIERARCVHTLGMRIEIRVAFLDGDLRTISVVHAPPGRVLRPRRGARHVLELRPDAVIAPGDVLRRMSGSGGTATGVAALYFRGCPRVGGAGTPGAPIV